MTALNRRQPVLVTGAAGFIGFHLSARLLERGTPVLGFDNLNAYYNPALKRARLAALEAVAERTGTDYALITADLEDPLAVRSAFRGETVSGEALSPGVPARVVHLAAQAGVRYSLENPAAYLQTNLLGFGHILEGCRHQAIKHLVYASSSSVYGGNRQRPYSERHPVNHPVSLYAATKKANELMAHTYSHLYGLPATGLRFFTVYGPWGRPDMAPLLFARAILAGEPIRVFNHGRMQRDFTFIDDIVEGVIRCLDKPASPDPAFDPLQPDPATAAVPHRLFNIGHAQPVALLRFIELLEQALGREAIKVFEPMQPGDVEATAADTTALEAWVDFRPQTPLDQGLARLAAWVKDHPHLLA
jgi:UDP-glucuronate 4-epimerase